MTWSNVRKLASYDGNTFLYGADGIRCRKNNITYTLDGNKILKETDGTNTTVYYYGASGIIGFNYNGTDYYFRKNLQGDVITIYTANGTKAATYIYDAWGKVLDVTNYTSDNIGDINPIRYRGYYYDTETELYYLESRYYDPETCRFINADTIDYLDPQTIGGLNLYVYCNNNPVNCSDPSGKFVISVGTIITGIIIGATIGAASSIGTTICKDYLDDGTVFNGSISGSEYLGGLLGGAIAGSGIGLCSVLGAAAGVACVTNTAISLGSVALSTNMVLLIGSASAFITGGLGYLTRTVFNPDEQFEISDMIIESSANMVSGWLSYMGGMAGGITGFKVPGINGGIMNSIYFNVVSAYFGIYPLKIFTSIIKNSLKETY